MTNDPSTNNLHDLSKRFATVAPAVDYWSARFVQTDSRVLFCRQNTMQPVRHEHQTGVFIYLKRGNAVAYAATCDTSSWGLKAACDRALAWLPLAARHALVHHGLAESAAVGHYQTATAMAFSEWRMRDYIDALQSACGALKIHDDISDWSSSIETVTETRLFVSSAGARIEQQFNHLYSGLSATAYRNGQSQTRTGGGQGYGRQGGLEVLSAFAFPDEAGTLAEQALALTQAPPCPDGPMDLLLLPSQMYLQIHESIGHPLELDRILGDERNYAGTSFVTPEMFGQYTYGSPLLNVCFDPDVPGELANYAYDDDGHPAEKTYIIRDGILLTPLGSVDSQQRAGLPGVANARACSWNRPPIDRMANLNLLPGDKTLDALITEIEHGVMMEANRSWSIDDSRNKFQFGCEAAYLIKDGQRGPLLRNPNYRGISATFWRNLKAVGDATTMDVLGTPHCGKGEPNQSIHVGHASPACVFGNVEVFGAG